MSAVDDIVAGSRQFLAEAGADAEVSATGDAVHVRLPAAESRVTYTVAAGMVVADERHGSRCRHRLSVSLSEDRLLSWLRLHIAGFMEIAQRHHTVVA